ncbi:MAG: beta-galactosidase [Planctomycetota bacterium]
MSEPAPRIAITPRGLSIDGRSRLLYGGEVQYYRVRDPEWDARRTEARWAETLDRLLECGMNVVTTYVPWDHHERQPGQFDFTGPRDLGRFLELCQARDLPVVLKPGPWINSEWPRGVPSFGAIPRWFRAQHPGAFALRPTGERFSTDPLGRAYGWQPSPWAQELRRATARWLRAVAPLVRRFVDERVVFALQLDNETNLFFASRYWADYSPPALRAYRAYLARRYETIAALNEAYGSRYSSFQDVLPPERPPRRGDAPERNRIHDDWFQAAQEGFRELHAFLRETWEGLGLREPEVLFLTNDSPHTFPGRELCLWDGRAKNAHGLACLDSYPRQLPFSGRAPADLPFLTALFSKRFRASNDAYGFARQAPVRAGKCYAVELEGGLFEVPGTGRALPVPVATTELILLQHLGRGSALAVIYVFRAGLNVDGTPYFGDAALGVDGRPQPRFAALRRFGRLVQRHGDALLASEELEPPVALVLDGGLQAPAGGGGPHPGKTQVDEACAVFGWLEDAGLNPAVIDLQDGPLELSPYRLVVFLDPGAVPLAAAEELSRWTRAGGVLLHLLGDGRRDERWTAGGAVQALLADGLLRHGEPLGERRVWPLLGARIELDLPGQRGALPARPFLRRYRLRDGATPLAWERGLLGARGAPVAWQASADAGRVVHFGTNPAALFGSAYYYRAPRGELLRARALARWLAGLAGVRPLVALADGAGCAWARRGDDGATFVFLASRLGRAARVRVDVLDPISLGLTPSGLVAITECLSGRPLGERPAASLARDGLALDLSAYGTAVLRLGARPAR